MQAVDGGGVGVAVVDGEEVRHPLLYQPAAPHPEGDQCTCSALRCIRTPEEYECLASPPRVVRMLGFVACGLLVFALISAAVNLLVQVVFGTVVPTLYGNPTGCGTFAMVWGLWTLVTVHMEVFARLVAMASALASALLFGGSFRKRGKTVTLRDGATMRTKHVPDAKWRALDPSVSGARANSWLVLFLLCWLGIAVCAGIVWPTQTLLPATWGYRWWSTASTVLAATTIIFVICVVVRTAIGRVYCTNNDRITTRCIGVYPLGWSDQDAAMALPARYLYVECRRQRPSTCCARNRGDDVPNVVPDVRTRDAGMALLVAGCGSSLLVLMFGIFMAVATKSGVATSAAAILVVFSLIIALAGCSLFLVGYSNRSSGTRWRGTYCFPFQYIADVQQRRIVFQRPPAIGAPPALPAAEAPAAEATAAAAAAAELRNAVAIPHHLNENELANLVPEDRLHATRQSWWLAHLIVTPNLCCWNRLDDDWASKLASVFAWVMIVWGGLSVIGIVCLFVANVVLGVCTTIAICWLVVDVTTVPSPRAGIFSTLTRVIIAVMAGMLATQATNYAAESGQPASVVWGGSPSLPNTPYPACQQVINGLSVVDHCILGASVYGSDDAISVNTASWFANASTPLTLLASEVDTLSGVRFVGLRNATAQRTYIVTRGSFGFTPGGGNPVFGYDWAQNANIWAEAAILQLLDAVSPPWIWTSATLQEMAVWLTAPGRLLEVRSELQYINELINYVNAVQGQFPNDTITLTGHSLAGGLSAIVGQHTGNMAVSFSGPGLLLSARKLGLTQLQPPLEYVVVPARDIVPQIDIHVGATQPIACLGAASFLQCHEISRTCCEMLRSCGDARGRTLSACETYT